MSRAYWCPPKKTTNFQFNTFLQKTFQCKIEIFLNLTTLLHKIFQCKVENSPESFHLTVYKVKFLSNYLKLNFYKIIVIKVKFCVLRHCPDCCSTLSVHPAPPSDEYLQTVTLFYRTYCFSFIKYFLVFDLSNLPATYRPCCPPYHTYHWRNLV